MKQAIALLCAVLMAAGLVSCKPIAEAESSATESSMVSSVPEDSQTESSTPSEEPVESSGLPEGSFPEESDTGSSVPEGENLPEVSGEESIPVEPVITTDISSLDNTKIQWGPGVQYDEKNRPVSCLQLQEKYGQYGAVFLEEDQPVLYLTFDEGYENGFTGQILDVLKEKETSAVFFVTMPFVKDNPDLIQRMIDEGHVVGNHSTKHLSMPDMTMEDMEKDLMELHTYMEENFQYTMTLFRPPMGEFSVRTLALAQKLGYRSVFWSFAYADWYVDNQPDPTEALEKVTSRGHNGGVFLLHAVSETNAKILGDVIDQLTEQGFTIGKLQ